MWHPHQSTVHFSYSENLGYSIYTSLLFSTCLSLSVCLSVSLYLSIYVSECSFETGSNNSCQKTLYFTNNNFKELLLKKSLTKTCAPIFTRMYQIGIKHQTSAKSPALLNMQKLTFFSCLGKLARRTVKLLIFLFLTPEYHN